MGARQMTDATNPSICGAPSYKGRFCELPFLHDGWHAVVDETESGEPMLYQWLDPIPVDENGEARVRIPYDQ